MMLIVKDFMFTQTDFQGGHIEFALLYIIRIHSHNLNWINICMQYKYTRC